MQCLQIAHRLREVFLNGQWVANTNYKSLLCGMSWQNATYQIVGLNTIAQLVFHINYYLSGVLEVLKGGPLKIKDKYSFDLHPITTQAEWEELLDEFLSNAVAFANEVEKMPEDKLYAVFVDEKYGTYLRNLEGMIEHSYYHMGQISLIKKMIENK